MSERNKNRPGYKKTKVGWIPEAWDCVPISDLISELLPGVSVNTDDRPCKAGESGVLKVSAVANGVFFPEENKVIKPEEIRRARGRPSSGNLIISRANTSELVGTCGYVSRDYDDLFLPDKLWQTYFSQSNPCCAEWLNALLQIPRCRYEIAVRATGTSGSMKNISQRSFLSIRVPRPPFPEQKKIAEILSTWDEAIDHTRRLIGAKERRKKALMQQLLTGERRLPGFNDEWLAYRLDGLLKQVSRPIEFDDDAVYRLISVRRRSEGIFLRSEMPGNNIRTKQMHIARKGDFLISKMQIVHGASALVTEEFDGMHISGSYIALKVDDTDNLDIAFFNWMSTTPYFYHLTYLASHGVHIEKMTFSLRLFLKSKIRIPKDVKEQRRIAEVLSSADDEIAAEEKKLIALKKQKRGLMQKLLTGEVRVKT